MDGIITGHCDILVQGPTVVNGNGGWGIHSLGKVTIGDGMMSSISNNGGGGIYGRDIVIPQNMEIANNGGAGLVCIGDEPLVQGVVPDTTVVMNNVRIHDNDGNGIEGEFCNFDITGTASEIFGNQGHGITSRENDTTITITATTEIHDNWGFGIFSLGDVNIHEGAMSSLNNNGDGGISAAEITLPPGMEIGNNAGPGIICLGEETTDAGACSQSTLTLDDVWIHDNLGNGIETIRCNVLFQGTGSVIDNNEGHGIFMNPGPSGVTIEAEGTEITNNTGWGISITGYVDITENIQVIGNSEGGIKVVGGCAASGIWDSSFSGNGGYAVHLNGAGAYLANNVITGNTGGIMCESGANATIIGNIIRNNTGFGVNNPDPGVIIDAENNYWGHASGPGGVGPGSGDAVSEYVDFDPWTGGGMAGIHEETVQPGTGTVDSLEESDTEVDYDTTGEVTITTQKFVSNPGSGFEGDIGKYIDVHLDSAEGVSEITIKLYYTDAELDGKDESALQMTWWNGQSWIPCSDTGVDTANVDGYAGYIWTKVQTDSSPALTDMIGTPFGAAYEPEEVEDDDDGFPVAASLIGLVLILLMAGIGFYLMSEKKGTGNSKQKEADDEMEPVSSNEEKKHEEGKDKVDEDMTKLGHDADDDSNDAALDT